MIEIISKQENQLLERIEVEGLVTFEGATPSVAGLTAEVAQHLHHEPAAVAIQHIYTRFGQTQARFTARLYPSPEVRKKIEVLPSHLKKKEREKKGETKAQDKKEGT